MKERVEDYIYQILSGMLRLGINHRPHGLSLGCHPSAPEAYRLGTLPNFGQGSVM